MKQLIKIIVIAIVLITLWQVVISIFAIPRYILAAPADVAKTLIERWDVLLKHAKVTLLEILLGLFFGFSLGVLSAITLAMSRTMSSFLMPLLVLSQAIPVFAIAPLLVLWLGYGMASKVVMAVLIIYFPVTAACYDGLRNTPLQWLQLAQSMRASKTTLLFKIRLPAALPSLASGLRIAVTFAPIGAIVGEWVGSAEGLGYLMLQANARMQVDTTFAALLVLIIMSLTLFFSVDALLKKYIPWQSKL
ncbi:MAG: ABC transporter permease [Gammaproteobacteria bacterium]|nr:MAG: ABC transporter permease [Gammaproteobacteria bacterium]